MLALRCYASHMQDRQLVAWGRRTLQTCGEVLLVSAGCVVAGWAVGTAAHYLGGALAWGLDLDSLWLAAFEGGINGAAIGLVVGLVVFYGILLGRVTWKDWVIFAGVAFSTAAITFLRLGLTTLIVTPLVTLTAALVLRSKNLTQTRRG
jgi:hypothetical protein